MIVATSVKIIIGVVLAIVEFASWRLVSLKAVMSKTSN